MTIYTTHITDVRCTNENGLTDVVRQIDFVVYGDDQGCQFNIPGRVSTGEASPSEFIPFADLTEAQVVGWVEASPQYATSKEHVDLVLAKMVAEAALTNKPLPWAPSEDAGANVQL